MYFRIKINIRQRCEKNIFDKPYDIFIDMLSLILQNFSVTADPFDLKDQQILQIGDFRCLSANPKLCAALSVRCLLTLIAKHFVS